MVDYRLLSLYEKYTRGGRGDKGQEEEDSNYVQCIILMTCANI